MLNKVLAFWFEELTPQQWFTKDLALDLEITNRFQDVHRQATAGELFEWRASAEGCLAEVIVLDQFSRNIYRDKPEAFASDSLALVLSQQAISKGFDLELEPEQRSFLYMPFMHSESKRIHQEALKLFNQVELQHNYEFEIKHKVIIDQFGRYPHRNEILGRQSTSEEIEFLKQPGSSF